MNKQLTTFTTALTFLVAHIGNAVPNSTSSRNDNTMNVLWENCSNLSNSPIGPTGSAGPIGPVGPTGPTGLSSSGPSGVIGPTGPDSAIGATGPLGSPGIAGISTTSALVPFSSGLPQAISTGVLGVGALNSIVGFGTAVTDIPIVDGVINLTDPGLLAYAFSVPMDGVINSLAVYSNSVLALNLINSVLSLKAQLYISTTPNNIFSPIPEAVVTLTPALTGIINIGTSSNGLVSNLSIPVTAQTRLLLVFSVAYTSGDTGVAGVYTGYFSGGLTLAFPFIPL